MNKKKFIKILDSLNQELKNQNEVYKPTIFWREAVKKIFEYLRKNQLDNFKNYPLAKSLFVPSYNHKYEKKYQTFNRKNKKINLSKKFRSCLKNFLSGNGEALADYRVFKSSDNPNQIPKLSNFSESLYGNPSEQFIFNNKRFSRSSLNYILGLTLLKKKIKTFIPKIYLEIGGGYGSLGEILGSSKTKNLKYINIDLPPLSLLTEMYLSKIFGKKNVTDNFLIKKGKMIEIKKLKKFSSFNSWQIEKLRGNIDIFVNYISFQEMEPHVLENYSKFIIKLKPKYLLLRNLREGKQLKKKNLKFGVNKQILFKTYLKNFSSKYKLIEKNVVPYGFKTFDNFNSEILIFKRK